jgi:hypothetical protein
MASNRGKAPRSRGPLGWSVEFAGSRVGLSINPSYQAAGRGEIPTVELGGLKIVPKVAWLRKLGIADADIPAMIEALEKADAERALTTIERVKASLAAA